MLWFRRNYLPRPEDWGKWEASPLYAPDDSFRGVPKTWIGVAELDILRDEGIAYGEKLKSYGKEVTIKVYPRAPHPIMANDGEWPPLSWCLRSIMLLFARVRVRLFCDAASAQ